MLYDFDTTCTTWDQIVITRTDHTMSKKYQLKALKTCLFELTILRAFATLGPGLHEHQSSLL